MGQLARTFYKIAGSNDEQRIVFGLANVSSTVDGKLLTDRQGDQIPDAELENAVYELVESGARGDVNHDKDDVSVCVESFVATAEKMAMLLKALGIKDVPAYNGCAAWMGWRVKDDPTWQRVKTGELKGFSIQCEAIREGLPGVPSAA